MEIELRKRIPIVGTNFSISLFYPFKEERENIGWYYGARSVAYSFTDVYTIRPWGFLYTSSSSYYLKYQDGELTLHLT